MKKLSLIFFVTGCFFTLYGSDFQTKTSHNYQKEVVVFEFLLDCPLSRELSSAFNVLLNQQAKDTQSVRKRSYKKPDKQSLRKYSVKLKQPLGNDTKEALQTLFKAAATRNQKKSNFDPIKNWHHQSNKYALLKVE